MNLKPILRLFFMLSIFTSFIGQTFAQEENYETVKIGEQVWMKHNLKRDVLGSLCYDKDSLNCEKYGRLYFWHTAIDACPDGYRLPTDTDWTILTDYLGGVDTAGVLLMKGGESGFEALLGGNYHPDLDLFSYKELKGYYWTASAESYHTAWIRSFETGTQRVVRSEIGKSFYFSIRCIKVD